MRDVNASIDSVRDPATKAALRQLLGATLAAQAIAAAAARDDVPEDDTELRGWVLTVSGHAGVPETLIHDGRPGRTVGDVAAEVGMQMLRARRF